MKNPPEVRALGARPLAAIAALFALAIFANAVMVGCGGKSAQSGQTEATPSTSTGTEGSQTATTPAPNPESDMATLGTKIYEQRCVLCHGPQGKGDGPGSAGLNPKPRNHTDGNYMNARTNEELTEVIHKGKGNMPAWGSILSDNEIRAVLTHVRSLAQPPYTGPMP